MQEPVKDGTINRSFPKRMLLRGYKSLRRAGRHSQMYQDVRQEGTDERWKMIEPFLDSAGSLLDVGCNIGGLTARAASKGIFAVGLDGNASFIEHARRRTRGLPSVAFMQLMLSTETVGRLPRFDVVLCLSVHHQWAARHGHPYADGLLGALAARTHRRLFFEPASTRAKYGAHPPTIKDHDSSSIVDHNLRMLARVLEDGWEVEHLGKSACRLGDDFRHLFTATRVDARGP